MLAAFTYSVMKMVNAKKLNGLKDDQSDKILKIGLSGTVMQGMFGFKGKFEEALAQIEKCDIKRQNSVKMSFETKSVDSDENISYLGIFGVSKYIWMMDGQKTK